MPKVPDALSDNTSLLPSSEPPSLTSSSSSSNVVGSEICDGKREETVVSNAPSSFSQAHQPSGSKRRQRPQSILRRSTEPPLPFFEVTPAISSSPTSEGHVPSVPQLQHATSSQSLKVSRSERSSTASSEDSSLISDSTLASGSATSTRTRATTLCSAPSSLNVSFAPLPKIEPRKRNSNRPIGLAARGMMLRQKRMMALQQTEGYYEYDVDAANTIPGGEHMVPVDNAGFEIQVSRKPKPPKPERTELDDMEDPIIAIGKAVSGATKGLWKRISSSRLNENNQNGNMKGSTTKRNLSWPLRRKRTEPTPEIEESSDDEVEGPWSRRKNEDPMTKTIMEGSEEEAAIAIPRYILSYDAVLGRDELGGDFIDDEDDSAGGTALSRAHNDIHTTVEVHVVRSASDDEQDEKQPVEVEISVSR